MMTKLLRRSDENTVKIVVVGYKSKNYCGCCKADDDQSFSESFKAVDAEENKKYYVIIKTILAADSHLKYAKIKIIPTTKS
jgi:hypothetical protein